MKLLRRVVESVLWIQVTLLLSIIFILFLPITTLFYKLSQKKTLRRSTWQMWNYKENVHKQY